MDIYYVSLIYLAVKFGHIYKPNPIKDFKKVYHWSLPFDHGMYNEGFRHLNTYSTHNYISETNPVNNHFQMLVQCLAS